MEIKSNENNSKISIESGFNSDSKPVEKRIICIICKYPIKTNESENRNLFFASENLEFDIIEHQKECLDF